MNVGLSMTAVYRYPRRLIVWFLVLSLAPSALSALGVDFGTPLATGPLPPLDDATRVSELHNVFRGSFIHLLTEWSAFCIAIFTVLLARAYARHVERGDVATVIALALFASGCLDAFHSLASVRLVVGASDPTDFIPFTWVLSRMFHVLVIAAGVGFLLLRDDTPRERRHGHIYGVALVLAALAFTSVYLSATTPELPQTMYPDAIISRPWDFIPLVLFIAISTLLLPRFHRRYPSPFATALWLSTVPDIVTEFHMAFGSETLFDNSFHIAHFTKIVAYAVPMSGLLMDYALTHRKLSQSNQRAATLNAELTRHAAELGRTNEALARTNDDLERFAYAASHDLRAPLRAIDNLSQWLEEDIGEQLEGENREHFQLLRRRVKRMDELLNALLLYSRVGRIEHQVTEVDVRGMLLDIAEAHGLPAAAELELPDALPTLHTDRAALHQVFANLVSNAIKHHDRDRVHITISHERRGDDHHFTVQDDGPGIPPQFHQKVFEMFQTLRPRDELEASGMGLALVKKQVELSGGTLTLSCPGKRGTTFAFSWPDRWPDHHPTTTTPSHQSM